MPLARGARLSAIVAKPNIAMRTCLRILAKMQAAIRNAHHVARYSHVENHRAVTGEELIEPGRKFVQRAHDFPAAAEIAADGTKIRRAHHRKARIQSLGSELVVFGAVSLVVHDEVKELESQSGNGIQLLD